MIQTAVENKGEICENVMIQSCDSTFIHTKIGEARKRKTRIEVRVSVCVLMASPL